MRQLLLRLLRDPAAVTGLVILAALLFIAAFGEMLAPYPEDAFEAKPWQRLLPPSAEHPFGTDGAGADVLSRILLGARIALFIAIGVVGASMLIGVAAGLYAGYHGGRSGEFVMRVTDIFLSVPQLVLALVLTASLGAGLQTAMVALAISYWPFFCRIVYGETQRISASLFVEALEGAGLSTWRIALFHILPNTAPAIIVRATIGMGITILTAAALGFMGLGAEPPTPEWGLMIADARRYLPDAWWCSTFPGLAILLTVLAFNLVGDSLRDIIDPRIRRSR